MSTCYRIATKGARLSLTRLKAIGAKILTEDKDGKPYDDGHICVYFDGYVHLYRTGEASWNALETFGGNNIDGLRTQLEQFGYTILSEYDEGFFY